MVDVPDSKSGVLGHGGSTPSRGTKKMKEIDVNSLLKVANDKIEKLDEEIERLCRQRETILERKFALLKSQQRLVCGE